MVELRLRLKALIHGAFLVVWVVHSNRALLKEERNCNTTECLSICICNQMHYGGYMLYYFQR